MQIQVFAVIYLFSIFFQNSISQTIAGKEAKIVGGLAADVNETQYLASIRLKSMEKSHGYGYGHICGSSVISQRLLLTAAHCIINRSPAELIVVMGSSFLYRHKSTNLRYNVQNIIQHTDFNVTTLLNDIALIFINGYIPWQWPTVKAIQLNAVNLSTATICKVYGWGKTNKNSISPVVMGGSVPINSNRICSKSYGDLPESVICAGDIQHGGIDACQGDSGGPLQCNGYLAGIVSWGEDCAKPNYPGIYTNVSYFKDWIILMNNTLNYTLYNSAQSNRIHLNVFYFLIILITSLNDFYIKYI